MRAISLCLLCLAGSVSAASQYRIESDNRAAIAEHAAKKSAAKAAIPQVATLATKAEKLAAAYQRSGKVSSPEVLQFSQQLNALRKSAEADFGIGQFSRPLVACGGMVASLDDYWSALLVGPSPTNGVQFMRKVYKESVVACKDAIAHPPELEIIVVGPPNAEGPKVCSQVGFIDSKSTESKWVCPPNVKL